MNNKETSDLVGQRQLRIQNLNKLRDLGIDPYPAKSLKTHNNKQISDDFSDLENKEVIVSGRITSWRTHGKIIFSDIADLSGKVQIYIKEEDIAATDKRNIGFNDLNLIDLADFIEVKGIVTKTQTGQISVLAKELRIISKTIRPIPEKLEDKEERFRRRYVDMNVHPEIRDRFIRRSKFWDAHREFLNSRGFVEINIPVLEHVPGGGDAVPFSTHMNAIDEDFFLRISHELPLKRLIGAGFEKVYDIGARFRNEGLSDEHLPEHNAMEFYWAYADWKDGMKLIQELFNFVIDKVYDGQKVFKIREFEVDFSKEWEMIDFGEIFQKEYGIDVYNPSLDEVKKLLIKHGVHSEKDINDPNVNIPRGIDSLWKLLRKKIAGPAFLINHPKYLSPLQKPSLENPNIVERCQPIIAGSELGNGWSELNDPIEQFDRFYEQQKMRDSGDEEAQWMDVDYVEMLEYGMPPTFGWGHSERVFWFFENVTAREGVPFPQLKMSYDDITKKIYSQLDWEEMEKKEVVMPQSSHSLINVATLPSVDKVHLDNAVAEKFPGIKFGYIIIENAKVKKENAELEAEKKSIGKVVKSRYTSTSDIKTSKNLKGYQEIYKGFGVDPRSRLNSSEAIIRRIVDGKGLYNINTVVDSYNVTSAELELPMAAYDLDQIDGDLHLRFAKEGEEITKIGDEEPTKAKEGELIYADDKGIVCLDFNYRDSNRTKITNESKNIIVFVDGHEGVSENDIKNALGLLGARLEKYTGGKVVGFGASF